MIYPQIPEIESIIEKWRPNRLLMGSEHGLVFGSIWIVPQSIHPEDRCSFEIPNLY